MRLFVFAAAALAASLPFGAAQAGDTANPLLGQWQQAGPASPALRGFRSMLFTPDTMLLTPDALYMGGPLQFAVSGYDVAEGAVRVRAQTGEAYVFVLREDGMICLAQTKGVTPLQTAPRLAASDRCFARRSPAAS